MMNLIQAGRVMEIIATDGPAEVVSLDDGRVRAIATDRSYVITASGALDAYDASSGEHIGWLAGGETVLDRLRQAGS
jgi:hypothetical protein